MHAPPSQVEPPLPLPLEPELEDPPDPDADPDPDPDADPDPEPAPDPDPELAPPSSPFEEPDGDCDEQAIGRPATATRRTKSHLRERRRGDMCVIHRNPCAAE